MDPRYTFFRGSRCARNLSPKLFTVRCMPSKQARKRVASSYGICEGPANFCIEAPLNGKRTAWCSATPSFSGSIDATAIRMFIGQADPAGGQSAEIILIGDVIPISFVKAYTILLLAVDEHGISLAPPAFCEQCTSLTIEHTPPGTTKFQVRIQLVSPLEPEARGATMNGYVWYDRETA